jgi:hypothetical protein
MNMRAMGKALGAIQALLLEDLEHLLVQLVNGDQTSIEGV